MNINRRHFLRGIGGATLALPWLESLSDTPKKTIPTRMAHFYVPIGVVRRGFFPGEENDIIPKGNLGNLMHSLGEQSPFFSVEKLKMKSFSALWAPRPTASYICIRRVIV